MTTGKTITVVPKRNKKVTAATAPYLKNLFIQKLRKHQIAELQNGHNRYSNNENISPRYNLTPVNGKISWDSFQSSLEGETTGGGNVIKPGISTMNYKKLLSITFRRYKFDLCNRENRQFPDVTSATGNYLYY